MADDPSKTPGTPAETPSPQIIPLAKIHDLPGVFIQKQPDKSYGGLVSSIQVSGVKVPVILRLREDGEYQLVTRYRRRRGSELARKQDIPAYVYDMTLQQAVDYHRRVQSNPDMPIPGKLIAAPAKEIPIKHGPASKEDKKPQAAPTTAGPKPKEQPAEAKTEGKPDGKAPAEAPKETTPSKDAPAPKEGKEQQAAPTAAGPKPKEQPAEAKTEGKPDGKTPAEAPKETTPSKDAPAPKEGKEQQAAPTAAGPKPKEQPAEAKTEGKPGGKAPAEAPKETTPSKGRSAPKEGKEPQAAPAAAGSSLKEQPAEGKGVGKPVATAPDAKGPAGTQITQVFQDRLAPPDKKALNDLPSPKEGESYFIVLHPGYLEKSKFNKITVDPNSDDYRELKKSIELNGVKGPVLTRINPEGGGLEIVSGQRRHMIAKELNQPIPAIIQKLDDADVMILVNDGNLHRPHISTHDLAIALRGKMEGMKQKAGRKKGAPTADELNSDEKLAQEMGMSVSKLNRIIRLSEATKDVCDRVDDVTLALSIASAVSFLKPDHQDEVLHLMGLGYRVSTERVEYLKKVEKAGKLDEKSMRLVLEGENVLDPPKTIPTPQPTAEQPGQSPAAPGEPPLPPSPDMKSPAGGQPVPTPSAQAPAAGEPATQTPPAGDLPAQMPPAGETPKEGSLPRSRMRAKGSRNAPNIPKSSSQGTACVSISPMFP